MEQEDIHHPNDKLFKAVFSKRKAVIEYFRNFLPKHIFKKLRLNTLKSEDNSYLGNDLKNIFSDMVFTCEFGKKGQRIRIAVLLEHKSQKEEYIHFQLLKYILGMWELQIQNEKPLTPVIPIVFYHGLDKWEYRPLDAYFDENLDEDLFAFIPNFDYIFNDLQKYSDRELKLCERSFFLHLEKIIK